MIFINFYHNINNIYTINFLTFIFLFLIIFVNLQSWEMYLIFKYR